MTQTTAETSSEAANANPSPPPKILFVSTLDRIIGVMFPHLEAARAAGWRVEVACQPTVFRDDLTRYADAVHEVPMRRFPLHPSNLMALARLIRLIRRERYHIVHAHNPTGGFVGRLAATWAGTGAVRMYTAHGFHFHRHGGRLSNLLYKTIEGFAGHFLSDGVLVITREDYEMARQGNVVPEKRLFLTGGVGVSAYEDFDPTAVSAAERAAIRREIGAEDETVPVLTVIGEMIPRKRHTDAIAAFATIYRQHPNAILLLVGDGALGPELVAQAQSLGITDAVRFLGFRRDIRAILAATDVFLFPSKQEGLPCAVQEALSMEVPVIATDVRGSADLVDETCGRLVPLYDAAAMASAAAEILRLPRNERRRMGQAGREKMLYLYERGACVRQWRGIYTELLARKGYRS
jgi:glycosyltransferase involved in cell wall biosynthesis